MKSVHLFESPETISLLMSRPAGSCELRRQRGNEVAHDVIERSQGLSRLPSYYRLSIEIQTE